MKNSGHRPTSPLTVHFCSTRSPFTLLPPQRDRPSLFSLLNAIAPTQTLAAIALAENDKSFVEISSFDTA